jgi:hypothetical protein
MNEHVASKQMPKASRAKQSKQPQKKVREAETRRPELLTCPLAPLQRPRRGVSPLDPSIVTPSPQAIPLLGPPPLRHADAQQTIASSKNARQQKGPQDCCLLLVTSGEVYYCAVSPTTAPKRRTIPSKRMTKGQLLQPRTKNTLDAGRC